MFNVQTNYEQNTVPVFNTYEEYHKMVLQSFENISIVLNIEGKVVFVSQNVTPLLGYLPEDIIGTSLLNLVHDEQKDDISEKIILNLPLANIVGSLIEFCCYIRKGNVGQSGQDTYCYRTMYQGRYIYEYVKFILYLQDSYDESFVFFGNFGPNSRKIWSSAPRLLWEEKYYVVGNISVLRTPDETAQPVNIQTNAVDDDSDDDSTLQHHRLGKRHRRNKMQTDAQAEAVNVEECPEAGTEAEIVEVQAATQRMPFDLIQVRTPSHSSITPELSAATSISAGMRTSTSSSSTDISSTTPVSPPTSRQGYEIDPKYMLEPQDREFEVGPEFLLNDSQDTEATPEQGECTEEDVKKPLVEAKLSNPKPKRTYQYHHPLFGEKFAQLCGPQVKMTEVYDLNISRSFYGEQPSYPDIEEEHREQEQCEYEFSQCTGMLRNLKYERPRQQHTGQGQGPRVYHPGEQVVTVIDDVGSPTMEFFGNDNSQHSRNETHRCWEDPIDCAPPPLHHSSRSFQEMTGSHQTLAASFQASLLSSMFLLTTEERKFHAFCPLDKITLVPFRLNRTLILTHEQKMRLKTDFHCLHGNGPYKMGESLDGRGWVGHTALLAN
nr:circadian clock protein PASD1-like [Arvicanthis niloticus]